MALWIHLQSTAFENLGFSLLLRRRILRIGATKDRLYPLDEKALGERLADEIVGAHLEAEQLINLLVLRRQENHRQIGLLPQAPQKLHSVHARHLDVENGEVGRIGLHALERARAVGVSLHPISFRLER